VPQGRLGLVRASCAWQERTLASQVGCIARHISMTQVRCVILSQTLASLCRDLYLQFITMALQIYMIMRAQPLIENDAISLSNRRCQLVSMLHLPCRVVLVRVLHALCLS